MVSFGMQVERGEAIGEGTALAEMRSEARFFVTVAALYLLVTVLVVFAVDPFWSANWDAEAFWGAARTFYDGGSLFDLYEKGREQYTWPYLYPPLYAMLLAPFVWIADAAWTPEWSLLLAVRAPLIVSDLGVAFTLYALVWETTRERILARIAALAWLFTPILFYQTAIQAHHESAWLWPVLAAYWWLARREHDGGSRWPALLLAVAVALKQTAILYVIPVGLYFAWHRRWRDIAILSLLLTIIAGGLSLPFHLHSDDFLQLVVFEPARQPVQTQSWIIWLLALKPFLVEQTRSTFPLIKYSSLILVGLTTVVSLGVVARRSVWNDTDPSEKHNERFDGWWFSLGLTITLLFFLTSQKVMAYHYPMVVPWVLAVFMPAGRLRLVTFVLVWVSWIVVSPYYAPWAAPSHLPFYAMLGTLNSIFFLGLLWNIVRVEFQPAKAPARHREQDVAGLLGWLVLFTVGFLLAAAAHPFTLLVPESGQTRQMLVFGLLAGVFTLSLVVHALVIRPIAEWVGVEGGGPQRRHVVAAVWFIPLVFTWFAMTREITAVLEKGVWPAWGL